MKKLQLLSLLAIPFLLTACGEGWEVKLSDDIAPYGNKRTAGSTYVYVLAKMMPAKGVQVEPAQAAPVQDGMHSVKRVLKPTRMQAEEIFNKKMMK